MYRLQHVEAQERGLQVTSVSWNCTGSVIGCGLTALSSYRHFKPLFFGWSSLWCHGGLYSGEVLVWDTSRSQDLILSQTGMSVDTHCEPVYQVSWVPGARRVLLWTVDGAEAKLILSSGYALVQQQVPWSGAASKTRATRASTNIGVTSVALSPWDLDTFLVGSEGGLVLKCSFSSETVAAVPPDGLVQMFDLGRRSLKPVATIDQNTSGQPTYCLEFNPKHTNLMAVGNADGIVNICQLSAELTEQGTKEMALLEQLANEVAD